jgi:hypothetical protein
VDFDDVWVCIDDMDAGRGRQVVAKYGPDFRKRYLRDSEEPCQIRTPKYAGEDCMNMRVVECLKEDGNKNTQT